MATAKAKAAVSKPFWQSRTIIANVVGAAATLAGVFGMDLGLDPDTQAQLVAGIMVVINIVLRLVTHKSIA